MTNCNVCRCKIDERREVRYDADGRTFCSPSCVVAWRREVGAW